VKLKFNTSGGFTDFTVFHAIMAKFKKRAVLAKGFIISPLHWKTH